MSRRARIPLFALILTLVAFAGGGGAPEPPLRNEDVVRMLVAGRPTRSILEAIRTRDVDFDLSDEMLAEMRAAEVPDEVLAAMRARQAEVERARPAAPEAAPVLPAPPAGGPLLHVHIRGGFKKEGESPSSLLLADRATDQLADWLQLGPAPEDRTITDAAVFLTCTTADHVPDQWRSKTPLGRDFVSIARHQMLDFHPGATPISAKEARRLVPHLPAATGADGKAPGYLRLPLPEELTAPLEPGVAHDLVVGVAVRVHDIWMQVASTPKKSLVPGTTGENLTAEVTEESKEAGLSIELRFD